MRVLARARLIVHDPVAPELPLFGGGAAGRAQAQRGGGAVVELGPVQLVGGKGREIEIDGRGGGGHAPLERERGHTERLGEARRRAGEREHAATNRKGHRAPAEEEEAGLLLVEHVVIG